MTQAMADAAAERRGRRVPYEWLFWAVFVLVTGLWTADRLTTNVWPRQSFGSGVARIATDDTEGLKDGPWSVVLYDVLARCTGRVLICTTNGLFFTMMHSLFNWLSEREGCWVDFAGWQEVNMRVHVVLGWATGVLILLHVWSPWCPVFFSGWTDVRFVWPGDRGANATSVFLFPVTEWKNCTAGHADVDVETESLCVNSDDLGRLVGMMLMFCVLFPLSRAAWALRKNWMVAKWLHVVLAWAFVFDLVRRRAHPHTWVLNVPVLLAYAADRFVGWYWYRVETCRVVGRLRLDDDYSVVYWRMAAGVRARVGDLYYVKAEGSGGAFERLHPFTCMSNRTGEFVPCAASASPWWVHHALVGDDQPFDTTLPEVGGDVAWDVAALVKVSRRNARRCCGGVSQTPLLASEATEALEVMGPYRSSYGALSTYEALPDHVTLIASGSGGSFLVDFANAVQAWEAARAREPVAVECEGKAGRKKVVVVYTSRSVPLLQFITDRLSRSELVDIDCSHVALTAKGTEFDPVSPRSPSVSSPRMAQSFRGLRSFSTAAQMAEVAAQFHEKEAAVAEDPVSPRSPSVSSPRMAQSFRGLRSFSTAAQMAEVAAQFAEKEAAVAEASEESGEVKGHGGARSDALRVSFCESVPGHGGARSDALRVSFCESVPGHGGARSDALRVSFCESVPEMLDAVSLADEDDSGRQSDSATAADEGSIEAPQQKQRSRPPPLATEAGFESVSCGPESSGPSSPRSLTVGMPLHDAAVDAVRTARLTIPEILEEHTPAGSVVFFCGSAGLLTVVQKSCRAAGLKLKECHEFDG
eukprot:TRINITY_DN1677_c0_g1_i1.p1 TRINITY_DN1677_c0_g1~~TRINITY_DN1677_c0_g1_i1.p1  ORF type:complete len:813 (+),score=325.77 TRINITY_DN1677_c0_g1_i1:94-2532(+)